ncbi:MAG: tetratricopeptide repeat protein [Pseudomonadota bacterium]
MIDEHQHFGFPKTAIHGNSFSIMANFDAVGRAFEQWSGSKLLQTSYSSITTAAFFSNLDFKKLPETRLALENYIKNFGPREYFSLSFHICSNDEEASLETCISILELSNWNPYIYNALNEQILKLVKSAKYSELEYLAENIHKVAENFYFIPNTNNLFFNIGIFLHDIEMFDKAIPYYKKSLSVFGEEYYALYNLGICFYKTDDHITSLHYFRQALEYDQEEGLTDWIKIVEEKLTLLKTKAQLLEEHA